MCKLGVTTYLHRTSFLWNSLISFPIALITTALFPHLADFAKSELELPEEPQK
jgi:hypothetical protein